MKILAVTRPKIFSKFCNETGVIVRKCAKYECIYVKKRLLKKREKLN